MVFKVLASSRDKRWSTSLLRTKLGRIYAYKRVARGASLALLCGSSARAEEYRVPSVGREMSDVCCGRFRIEISWIGNFWLGPRKNHFRASICVVFLLYYSIKICYLFAYNHRIKRIYRYSIVVMWRRPVACSKRCAITSSMRPTKAIYGEWNLIVLYLNRNCANFFFVCVIICVNEELMVILKCN